MSVREKIFRYYQASDDGDLAARLLDLAELAVRTRRYRTSEFLDPYGLSIAETIAAHYESLILTADGGYLGAERVKACFRHEDYRGTVDYELRALLASWDGRYYHLSHRDVLGALMGLGIKREVFGDIIMLPDSCQVIVDAPMLPFIIQNLTTIGPAPVTLTEISLAEIKPREERRKEIKTTIASLRLDAVAAAGFGTSRTKMVADITAGKVKVNWQEAKSTAQPIKVGDVISIRGRGRVEVTALNGQTKKGRISVVLTRFM